MGLPPIEQTGVFLSESASDLLRERKDRDPGEKSSKSFCSLMRFPGTKDAGDKFGERNRAAG